VFHDLLKHFIFIKGFTVSQDTVLTIRLLGSIIEGNGLDWRQCCDNGSWVSIRVASLIWMEP